MITYKNKGCLECVKALFQLRGSVFPKAGAVAIPAGIVAWGLRLLEKWGHIDFGMRQGEGIMTNKAAWTTFSSLVGFLIVFRTSIAYGRFWAGCSATHGMRQSWFSASTLLMAYVRTSKASQDDCIKLQGKLVRLFSMMHAAALAELEQVNVSGVEPEKIAAFQFEVLDPAGFDDETLSHLKKSCSKVELCFVWLMHLCVDAMDAKVISPPPPVWSQALQLLCKGMDAFHNALRITYIPFPFPYVQTCDLLIIIHALLTPVVIMEWVTEPIWAGVLTFLQVFTLQALDHIAKEIENPFGQDANDLDGEEMQRQMNNHLVLLMQGKTRTLPRLTPLSFVNFEDARLPSRQSMMNVFSAVGGDVAESERAGVSFSKGQLRQRHMPTRSSWARSLEEETCTLDEPEPET